MEGPNSYSGSYSACIRHEDYVFQFYPSAQCQNGTSEQGGQILALLCCSKE